MNCSSDKIRAAVTPMVCILSAAVILLNFCMLDAVQIRAIESLTERRNAFCAGSLLSFFYDTLERDYGLYGIYGEKESEIRNRYAEMLRGGAQTDLVPSGGADKRYRTLRLLHYEVTRAELSLERPLADPAVLQDQIGAIMKYKSTANLVEQIAEQAESLVSFSRLSGAYAKYLSLSALYDRYKGKLSDLQICLNGDGSFLLNCVNGFQNVIGLDVATARQLKRMVPPGLSHRYTGKEADQLKTAFSLFAGPARLYADYNAEAVRIADELCGIVTDADGTVREIKAWLASEEAETDGGTSGVSGAACKESIRQMTEEIENGISASRLAEISSAADENRRRLEEAYASWSACEQLLAGEEVLRATDLIETVDLLSDAYSRYRLIPFPAPEPKPTGEDLSDYLLETDAEEKMAGLIGKTEDLIPANLYNTLPSVQNTDGYRYYAAVLEDISSLRTTGEILKMLEGCGSVGSLIAANAEDSLAAYAVDDYIMSYFYSSEQESGRDRYLKGEIEYIISGKQSGQENVNDVYIKLLELRVALNTLHILCDSEKKAFADSVGQSLAAITGGLGAGLYTALVVGSWALAESVADLYELEDGRSVPLFKKKGDWITSVNGKTFGSAYLIPDPAEGGFSPPKNEITKASDVLSLDYTEYLRLLLLQVPKRVKLYRIQDLIELNLYKKTNVRIRISDLYTAVRCTAGTSVRTFVYRNGAGKRKYGTEAEYYAEM